MKIAYNPSGASPLQEAPENNNDIIFDLAGKAIYVKDVKLLGTDTIYDVFKKPTSSSEAGNIGLVPVPSYTNTNTRFLREDGTWAVPADLSNYLLKTGGAMVSNARISASGGNLYLGNSDNAGWLYLQDCASQSNISNWTIRTNGNAMFTNVSLIKSLTLTNTSGSYNGIVFNFDSAVGTHIYQTYDSSNNYYSLTIDGNIFIGGSCKGNLNVNGELKAQGGNFQVNSQGAFWTSDKRLKDNISNARNLNIDSLIKEFDWKDTGNHSWGFIAQDLLKVLPEAVNYNEQVDKYSVNYDVAHSAAIASLSSKVKQLELRIKELENGKVSNE